MHDETSYEFPFLLRMLPFYSVKLLTFRVIGELFGMYDFIELYFCRQRGKNVIRNECHAMNHNHLLYVWIMSFNLSGTLK